MRFPALVMQCEAFLQCAAHGINIDFTSITNVGSRSLERGLGSRSITIADDARSITAARSPSVNDSSTNTRIRDRSAPFTSNDGFSVVAPISVIVPCSTCGRNASCCARLNRWISSTNRMVGRPSCNRSSASPTISRTRGTPSVTAEKGTNSESVYCAISRPRVVFPVPGGPQKIIDPTFPCSIALRKGLPAPSSCSCPMNSASESGRIRAASGCAAAGAANNDGSTFRRFGFGNFKVDAVQLYESQYGMSRAESRAASEKRDWKSPVVLVLDLRDKVRRRNVNGDTSGECQAVLSQRSECHCQ